MTQQEQFEADYLAAFPCAGMRGWFNKRGGRYYAVSVDDAFTVWLQQEARHKDEIAELVLLLKRYRTETPIGHQPHMICHIVDCAIAKYEVEKK